jgi:cell wall-associated NlpC family hydrolase
VNRKLVTVATATVLAAAVSMIEAAPSSALTVTAIESKAYSIAKSKKGDLYQYGAAGPNRFDCSGLTYYSFEHAGRKLPRTASAQYNSSRIKHVTKANRKAGDLVFFHSGSSVYHVGIYTGSGNVLHAPYSGAKVRIEKIWTSSVWYGRLK